MLTDCHEITYPIRNRLLTCAARKRRVPMWDRRFRLSMFLRNGQAKGPVSHCFGDTPKVTLWYCALYASSTERLAMLFRDAY